MDKTDPLFARIIKDLKNNFGGVSFSNFSEMILEKGSFKKGMILLILQTSIVFFLMPYYGYIHIYG